MSLKASTERPGGASSTVSGRRSRAPARLGLDDRLGRARRPARAPARTRRPARRWLRQAQAWARRRAAVRARRLLGDLHDRLGLELDDRVRLRLDPGSGSGSGSTTSTTGSGSISTTGLARLDDRLGNSARTRSRPPRVFSTRLDLVHRRAVLLGRAGRLHRRGGRGLRLGARLERRLLPVREDVQREDERPDQQRADDPRRDVLRERVVGPVALRRVHGQPGRGNSNDEQHKRSQHAKPIGTCG